MAKATGRRARRDTDVVLGLVGAVVAGFVSWWFAAFGDGVVRSPLTPAAATWVSAGAAVLVVVGVGVRWAAERVATPVLGATLVVLALAVVWLLVVAGSSAFDGGGWLLTVGAAVVTSVLAVGVGSVRRLRRVDLAGGEPTR